MKAIRHDMFSYRDSLLRSGEELQLSLWHQNFPVRFLSDIVLSRKSGERYLEK